MNPIELFLANLEASLANESFRKLTLGKFRGDLEWRGTRLCPGCYPEERETIKFRAPLSGPRSDPKLSSPGGIVLVRDWLGHSSFAATLFTVDQRQQLLFNRRGIPSTVHQLCRTRGNSFAT